MPGRSQYPTGDDLRSYLLQAGFAQAFLDAAATNYDYELFALAGWEAFNREAGRTMLAVAGTRSYWRPHGVAGVIDLGEDLASGGSTSLTDQGTALTLNTDYVLEPLDAAGRGAPYNRVRFWRRLWSVSVSIAPPLVVTGLWGYSTMIPEDAWVGMLAMAALEMHPLLMQARTGGMVAWKEADMDESYGPRPLQALGEGWQARALRACGGIAADGSYHVGRYTRVTVG